MNFKRLVDAIRQVHNDLALQTNRAVNVCLTVRNWIIGRYIAEYKLNGADRAAYGERIFAALTDQLVDVSNCHRRQLYRYLRFYRLYPKKAGMLSPQCTAQNASVLERLSYSHIKQLVDMNDDTKRAFYNVT